MKRFAGLGGASSVWFSGLSRRPLRVVLTILGIASGVALSFSVAAQNASLTRGSAETHHALAGRAHLELSSLGAAGIDLSVLTRVRDVRGVAAAVPVSDEMVTLHHRDQSLDVRLIGATSAVRALRSNLTRAFASRSRSRANGIHLPAKLAAALGVGQGASVSVRTRTGVRAVRVLSTVPNRQLAALGSASVAIAPLPVAQALMGRPNRSQRILVVTRDSPPRDLQARLQAAAGPGVVVRATDAEFRALEQASALNRSASTLFATLSLVVGGLLAYGAMVLTVAERRREVATLRALGCGTAALSVAVVLDAVLLGAAGTALGLLGGRLALGWLLPADNSMLSTAFLLSTRSYIPLSVILLCCAAGVVTAAAAALLPARALSKVPPAAALRPELSASMVSGSIPNRLLLLLLVCTAVGGVAATIAGFGTVGVPLWIVAGVLTVPLALPPALRAIRRLLPSPGGAMAVGVSEAAAFPSRAIAATAVVALAVSGLIVINGAVADLETGTAKLAASTYPPGSRFVTVATQHHVFFTRPFEQRLAGRLQQLDAVESVHPWRSGFLDWDGRRVLVSAYSSGSARPFRPGELIEGDEHAAAREISTRPDAAAISSDLAAAHGLTVGDRFELPTPAGPRRVRVAALITNYGWVPGAIALNDRAMTRWWETNDVTALEVQLAPGADHASAARDVSAALSGTGLRASSSQQLQQGASAAARSQLTNLSRIGQLVALAGLLAVTAGTLAAVLGRIRQVSALRTIGMPASGLWIALASELMCIVGIGAIIGIVNGLVGQALVIRYLSGTFAMSVAFHPSPLQVLVVLVLCAATVIAATLVALRWALAAPLTASMREI